MDRRRFLHAAGGATAAAWFARCGPAGAASEDAGTPGEAARAEADDAGGAPAGGGSALETIGLQLYTVRSLMAEDVEGTLEEVARIGYREVEFAGYFERSPAGLRTTLDALGLRAPSTHLPIEVFRNGRAPRAGGAWSDALETAAAIGHDYLVLPYLGEGERGSLDGYRRIAAEMNGFGERCRAAGLRFGYHNHDFELAELGGRIPLEILIEETDPELVTFEMDLYWLVNGGGDPLDYIERYPGRFELCHVKDRASDGAMVDVGAGEIDFAAIFERSDAAGLRHYFVEHDRPDGPLRSIAASYAHLSGPDG